MKCCEVMEVAYQHQKIKSTRRNQTSQQPDDDNEIEMSDKNSNWSWNSSNSNSRWINLVPMPLATCWFSPQEKYKIKISQIFTPQPSSSTFWQTFINIFCDFRLAPLQPHLVVLGQFTRSHSPSREQIFIVRAPTQVARRIRASFSNLMLSIMTTRADDNERTAIGAAIKFYFAWIC